MARLARVEYEGAIYTVRGNNRRELFVDDRDRRFVEAALVESGSACHTIRLYQGIKRFGGN